MPWIKLKQRQLKKWVDALEQCQLMESPDSRNSVVARLRDDIRGNIPRNSPLRVDISNIIRTCDMYPGGLEELVGIIRLIEGKSHAVQALERLLEERLSLLDYEDRLEVLNALAGFSLPVQVLAALYGKSLTFPACPQKDARTLPEILLDLARLPLQTGVAFPVPLLEFVERLAGFVDPEDSAVASRLRAWIDRMAPEVSLSGEEIQRLRERLAGSVEQEEAVVVLVDVKPDPHEADGFLLSAWSWREGLGCEPIDLISEGTEDMPRTPGKIQEILARFLECPGERLPGVTDFTLELFLPRRLLCWDVDQWKIRLDEGFETPVGIHYPVVVRWRDRTWRKDKDPVGGRWRRKWSRMREGAASGEVFWILSRDQYRRNALYAKLISSDELFCSGLAFPPAEEPEPEDVLDTILLAGLPVAFWPRKPLAEAELCLTAIMQGKNVADLPEAVRTARLQAFGQEDEHHAGRHLTLLWDDADRKHPGAQPFSRPRQGGGNS